LSILGRDLGDIVSGFVARSRVLVRKLRHDQVILARLAARLPDEVGSAT
jgi:hypothetical protein